MLVFPFKGNSKKECWLNLVSLGKRQVLSSHEKKNKNKIPIITHIVVLVYITESKVLFEYIWFCVMCGLTKCQESEELEKNVYLKIEALVKWLRI